jgi:DNA-binding response OmpR family regulator
MSTFLQDKFKEQYDSMAAATTAKAWEILKTNTVQLIVLDIMLPEEDGFSFLEDIKSQAAYKDIPVLIVSNFGNEEYIKRGLSLGAVKYLVKANHTPADIAETVTAILNQPAAA